MGTLRYDKKSGWWIGSWVDAAGKQRRKRLARDKAYAKETLALLEGEALRNRLLEIRPIQRIRFDAFAEKFLTYCKAQIKSWPRYRTSLESLRPFFHNRFLTSIDPNLIEDYRQKRLLSVQKSTVNRDMQVLKRMYNLAITWGYARENPVCLVKFFRESAGRLRYLRREEFERLHRMSPAHLKPLLTVAVYSGMRQGELLALTWDDVDLENGFASINDPKNATPRKVPLSRAAQKAFLEMRIRGGSDRVFVDTEGDPLPQRTLQFQFTRLLQAAGIENFRFHDLRHTCASWLAMANVPILTIKEILGHKDLRMTLRYSHLSPDQKVDAVRRLDDFVHASKEHPSKPAQRRQKI